MEKRFKEGDELYLMVTVHDTEPTGGYDYTVEWKDAVDGMNCLASVGQAQLVSDADFGTSIDWQAKYNEYNEKAEGKIRELTNKLNEMDNLLKEAQSQAIRLRSENKQMDNDLTELEKKQLELENENGKLTAKVNNLETELEHARDINDYAIITERNRTDLIANLKAQVKRKDIMIESLLDRLVAIEEGENNG